MNTKLRTTILALSACLTLLVLVALARSALAVAIDGDFTPCNGAGTAPPNAHEGPWSNRLMIAYSDDGLTWTRANRVLADQGDVPDAIVDDQGTIRVYYVTWCPAEVHNQTVVALSADNGTTWRFHRVTINGLASGQPSPVDPDIVRTPDGRWRLYFTSATPGPGSTPHTYSAISEDGFTFQVESGERLAVADKQVLDPSAIRTGAVWHLFAGGNPGTPGENWHATANDGLNFHQEDNFFADGIIMSNGLAVEGGYRFYGFKRSAPPAGTTSIYSVFSTDGITWTMEPGTRLTGDLSSGLESDSVKDPAVAHLPDGRYIMIYVTEIPAGGTTESPTPTATAQQCMRDVNGNGEGDVADVMATATTPGCLVYLPAIVRQWGQPWPTTTPTPATADNLTFIPDPGIRVHIASNPAASVDPETGTVYLFYEDRTTMPGKRMVATSSDGLSFSNGRQTTNADNLHFPYNVRLPDGTWRKYTFDVNTAQLKSQSSTDGMHYKPDPGVRYTAQPDDNGKVGVHDQYVDAAGGVVLLYIGDMQGVNNVRLAYSPPGDNGWTFTFEEGDVLGDAAAGGGGHSYVDPKSILLPDGRRRLFTMRQGTLPPQPGVHATGKIFSFISQDGKSYDLEPGTRLQAEDFTQFAVWSLNDPVVVQLPDGRYRMYVAALITAGPNEQEWVIVSATTA
ncbi:MAG: hypothetical protein GXP41_11535 [Chloroflexi bacterium]|nr:hypothetical protein [Chloroflexota bacterium]